MHSKSTDEEEDDEEDPEDEGSLFRCYPPNAFIRFCLNLLPGLRKRCADATSPIALLLGRTFRGWTSLDSLHIELLKLVDVEAGHGHRLEQRFG